MVALGSKGQGFKWVYIVNNEQTNGNLDQKLRTWVQKSHDWSLHWVFNKISIELSEYLKTKNFWKDC